MASETDGFRQAWVTTILNKDDVEKALVLGRSFRQVMTTRRLVVITTPTLDRKFRTLLGQEFDQIFMLDHPKDDGNGLTLKDYAKLFCFTLQVFQKCVYLDPGSLILNNCDDIFDRYNSFNAVVMDAGKSNAVDSSIFFFVPSIELYETFVATMKNKHFSCKVTFETYLKDWMLNQRKDFEFMDPKYNRKIGISNDQGPMALEEDQLGIINFQHSLNFPQNGNQKGNGRIHEAYEIGTLEIKLLQRWLSIYETEVEPLISLIDQDQHLTGQLRLRHRSSSQPSHEPVAIVGMSCRYPGAKNLDEFWKILIEAREAVQQVPSERWTDDRCTTTNPDSRNTQASFLNVPVDEFDGRFFGISPKELEFLDPQQRLLMEVTWEALEDAAINPQKLRGTHTGVFSGAWMNDYKDQLVKAGTEEFYRTYMGNSFGAAAARISFFLGLTGPSVATESGCSSAMVAIDLACKSIRSGETPMAIACGVNLLLSPFTSDDISFVVSPDGRCKTFDAGADGFGRAEGCGVLVLKKLSDAVQDGDKIWALIRGSSAAQEGLSRSMGTPTRYSEALAMELALKDASVLPNQVDYVETHGTGTPVGDPMEIAAISDVYARGRYEPLVVGSVKTNIGHTESCSAMPGIMKVILSMKNEVIPAHRNLVTLNPNIELDAIPAIIPDAPIAWLRSQDKKRLAGVSSFGITGTDGHIIIEEPPLEVRKPRVDLGLDRPLHILTFSAKTEDALDTLVEKYQAIFDDEESEKLNFADICYSANVGRASFPHRASVIAGSIAEAKNLLNSNKFAKQEAKTNQEKLCFLFTGQGSQYHGMAQELYESSPIFRLNFDKCTHILKRMYDIDIRQALWDAEKKDELARSIFSQTSIFCVEYCLLKLWESWGIKPDYVLGHSLGEFSAAVAAGILELEDAIKLVAERSRLIDNLPQGKMLVIKADKSIVDNLLKEFQKETVNNGKWLDYAAINSKEQTVLAGDSNTVQDFSTFCQEKGLKTHVLEATHAFHSRHMDPILQEYEQIASTVQKQSTPNEVKYISGVDGKLITDPSYINENYWGRHTREHVNFIEASKVALEECTVFLEVGPHPVLSALIMVNNDERAEGPAEIACMPSLRRSQNDWKIILGTLEKLYLAGYQIDWNGFDQYIPRQKVDCLPFYPFQRKKFWFPQNEMGVMRGKSIHPLIGCPIPNATSLQLYQNAINLKNLEYLKDHCIGGKIVMPGASLLEMCLAAGHATTQCFTDSFSSPASPLVIEDLKILRPLLIDSEKGRQLQTVVDCSSTTEEEKDKNETIHGMKVQIFAQLKHDNEMPTWVQHATAQYSPVASNEDIQKVSKIDPESATVGLELFPTEEFYGKLAKIGLEFGPVFRSLSKVWKGKDHVLAQTPNLGNGYIFHPAIFDAMIQVTMIVTSMDKPIDKLHVPLAIKKCIFLEHSKLANGNLYIQCGYKKEDDANVLQNTVLYDGDGTPLVIMEGVELIQTSVAQIETLMDNHKSHIPLLWEEAWKMKGLGPWEKRADMNVLSNEVSFTTDFVKNCSFDTISEEAEQTEAQLDKIVYLYILDALYKLGWNKNSSVCQLGMDIKLEEFLKSMGIIQQHTHLVKYFFTLFEEEGIVKAISNGNGCHWKLMSLPPDEQVIQNEISSIEKNLASLEEFSIAQACGQNLANILKGEDTGLRILFPEDPKAPSAGTFYKSCYARREVFKMVSQVLEKYLQPFCQQTEKKDVLRIIEVGAGTGSFTSQLLALLSQLEIPFEYMYTDISAAFFTKAERKFENHKNKMKFKALNIEVDPAMQGFCPEYYDIVVAGDVIHATRSLNESVSNVRKLLRPNGSFWLLECTRPCREITLVFGLLEGYWNYNDFRKTPDHTIVSTKSWEGVMTESGFSHASSVTCFAGYHGLICGKASSSQIITEEQPSNSVKDNEILWLIFVSENNRWSAADWKKLEALMMSGSKTPILVTQSEKFNYDLKTRKCTVRPHSKLDLKLFITDITSRGDTTLEGVIYGWGLASEDEIDQANISQPYLNLIQILTELKVRKSPKLIVLSESIIPAGGDHNGTPNPSSGTLWGITKSLHNEYTNFNSRCVDLCVDDTPETRLQQIFSEIWIEDAETLVSYRDNKRLCGRLASIAISKTDLELPRSGDRFQLLLPETKAISDLQFGPYPNCTLQPDQIEVQVKATALNFRDVFAVLKPNSYFDKVNKVGLDVAGIVCRVGSSVTKWKVGDPVFGCNLENEALPSHICFLESQALAIPPKFTFAEAATLPAVFATVYYSLVKVADLKQGETVLLHTASGGVGLCAIQLCQHIGATIIATAGSSKKRAYLRTLGIQHVFHSRNTNYEQEILQVTQGKGVDVVLNSLTSPGFKEATLNSCGRNARFIEMSKLSIWEPEEVAKLRPDAQYTVVDLTTCSKEMWEVINAKMDELLQKGVANPIPYTRFDAVNIREALTYLQKAKHIGKVVCIMPEFKFEKGRKVTISPLFNERSTYVVTGGLGGIGLEVAKWMCTQGATNLLLCGRSKPNEKTSAVIKQLNSEGGNVIPYSADVGNFEQCKQLIDFIKAPESNLPPLRGIMHAAGVLQDAIISNQTWEKFQATYQGKVGGTWNLHELTKQESLEHFVMFSSIAGLFGPPGQSNHAASNAFLDAFTHYRQSRGLPATSVNWGAWGQVGVAVGKELPGVKPFSSQRALNALDKAMREQRTQICAAEIQMSVFQKFFAGTHIYLEDVLYKDSDKATGSSKVFLSSEKFWNDYNSAESSQDKINVLKASVTSVVQDILKLDKSEPIDETSSFQDIGLDSLMMVEMKNFLQGLLGKRVTLTTNDLRDCNNISLISQKLHSVIEGQQDSETNGATPAIELTSEDFINLIREDSQLPEHIRHLDSNAKVAIEECRTFLITGVTGNLAPYFIRDIFKYTKVSRVYCLIRAKTNELASQRLQAVLKDRDLLNSVDMSNISCIAGDITLERFGLDEETYNNLAREVDAIIHSAVKASHVELYSKSLDTSNNVRAVNVGGTIGVLEFAAHLKTKHILHSSTLLAVTTTDENGSLSEDWPSVSNFDEITQLGYPVSKFVCDLLMKEAVLERQIPCKVFRFPAITGDSESGRFNIQNNHFILRLLSYMRLRAMPSVPLPLNIVPADICANIALKIFFNADAPSDVYNVCQLQPQHEQEFVDVAQDFGFQVDVVEFSEFAEKLENEGEDSLLFSLRDIYLNEERYTSLFFAPQALQAWFVDPESYFRLRKVNKYAADLVESIPTSTESIKKDLLFAKSKGIFERLGIV